MATNGLVMSRPALNTLNSYFRKGLPMRGRNAATNLPATLDKQQIVEFVVLVQRAASPTQYAITVDQADAQAFLDSIADSLTVDEYFLAQASVDTIGPLDESDYGTDADPPATVIPWDV